MGETSLLVVGISHRLAAVTLRERVAFSRAELAESLRALRRQSGVRECVILSTCNRTECYAVVEDTGTANEGYSVVAGFLADRAGMAVEDLQPHIYYLTDLTVAGHLFKVASGLDSLVVGEVEILGQVKDALRSAERAQSASKWLYTLFRRAIETGKRARAETAISAGAASVSWAAVELARQRLPSLASAQVLLIGAGATAESVARALAAQGVEGIMVANRTRERAEALAATYNGIAVPFAQMLSYLVAADVVICSTDAPHAILSVASVQSTLPARHGRALCLIDVAVPRDVDPGVATLPGVELHDMDSLALRVDHGVRMREAEVAKVDQIVADEVERFAAWQSTQRVTSTIATLKQRAETVRQEELQRIHARLADLTAEEREAIEAATRAIINKMLHHPIALLRETALHGEEVQYVHALEELFDLSGSPPR